MTEDFHGGSGNWLQIFKVFSIGYMTFVQLMLKVGQIDTTAILSNLDYTLRSLKPYKNPELFQIFLQIHLILETRPLSIIEICLDLKLCLKS